jgi:hypothetical protein
VKEFALEPVLAVVVIAVIAKAAMLARFPSCMTRTIAVIAALGTTAPARFAMAMTLAIALVFRRVALRRDCASHRFRGVQQCLDRSTQIGHFSPKRLVLCQHTALA